MPTYTVPYVRRAYEDQSVGRLSDLLGRRGDVLARQAEMQGMASAQKWNYLGRTAGNALSTLAAVPEQNRLRARQEAEDAMRKREFEQRSQVNDLAIGAAQRTAGDDAALRDATSSLSQGMSLDDIYKRLSGHPQALESFNQTLDRQKNRDKEALGDFAADVLGAGGSTDALVHATNVYRAMGVKIPDDVLTQGMQNPESVTQRMMAILRVSPSKDHQELANSLTPKRESKVINPGDVLVEFENGKPVGKIDGNPKPPTPNRMQSVDALVDGSPQMVVFDPVEAKYYRGTADGGREDVTSRVKPIPRASDKEKTDEMVGVPDNYRYPVLAAIESASSPAKRASLLKTINEAYKSGGEDRLKEALVRAAVDSEGIDVKNQVMGRYALARQLQDIKTQFNELKRLGIEPGLLAGTLEQVEQKLGRTGNQKAAKLMTQLKSAFVNYRRTLTGAQFSPSESQEYESLMPSFSQNMDLNMARIDGMDSSLSSNQRSFLGHKVGDDFANVVMPNAAPQPKGRRF